VHNTLVSIFNVGGCDFRARNKTETLEWNISGYKRPCYIQLVSKNVALSGTSNFPKAELREPYWDGYDSAVN